MLAFAWPWGRPARDKPDQLARRLANSLCAGIAGHAGTAEYAGLYFAYRSLRTLPGKGRAWQPTVLPDGWIVVFHGYFDNAEVIAAKLGAEPTDVARLYGLAVARWGDDADRQIVGEYCALIAEPDAHRVRLSRSPLRAPPLYYFHDAEFLAVASVPRAIFAAGVEQRLNEARVADSALINFTDHEASWFEEIRRVPVGHIVELRRGETRRLRRYYDLLDAPDVRLRSDAEYVARASELLDEGVRACITGFREPGSTLSGGLDSAQVALRAAAALPPGRRLPTFTFHPEAGYDGRVAARKMGDERPMVEAFAAMHPQLDPHFTSNEGYGHDHRWSEFFHLMGGAPSGLCNMYVFHGLFSGAAEKGCDLLLVADWGNHTFSDAGRWAFVEYFLKGRWRQLWRALSKFEDERSLAARFAAKSLVPLLPNGAWKLMKRIAFPKYRLLRDLMQPLSREYRITSGAEQRVERSGLLFGRYQPWNRRDGLRILLKSFPAESDEVYQAFEQMYGVAQRDPTAYRPFAEFCVGLPPEMFMRDGESRWLAKQMAKGLMPERQRASRLHGRWDADWHLRIGRRRQEYLAELDRLAGNERFAAMFDFPRLRAALTDWPAHTTVEPQEYFTSEFAVPRALLTARFVNYVEGRND